MARPPKEGLDYFPLDTIGDTATELIEAEFGVAGYGVLIHLYQQIYRERGYYLEWTKEVKLLFCRKYGIGDNFVSEVLLGCVRHAIFDAGMFKKYNILTSEKIQTVYFAAVQKRVRTTVIPAYLLLGTEKVSDAETPVSDAETPVSSVKNTQRKEKKIKEKNNIFSPPSYEEAETYRKNNDLKMDTQEFLDYYSARGWHTSSGNPVDAWRPLMHGWARKQSEFDSKKSARQPRKNPAAAQTSGSSLDMDKLDQYIKSQFE